MTVHDMKIIVILFIIYFELYNLSRKILLKTKYLLLEFQNE